MKLKNKYNIYLILITVLVLFSGFILMGMSGKGQSLLLNNEGLLTPQVNNVNAPEYSDWSGFRYINAAGSSLKPRDSGQDWGNSGSGGCIYANTLGGEVMNLHLDIPTGSRIDYLRLFFYDTSASASNAWVTIYDGASGITDLTSVSSTGNTGYGTTLSAYVGHIVDNFNNSYVLNWRPNVTGNTMMLCGLRVAYRVPLTPVFLPLTLR